MTDANRGSVWVQFCHPFLPIAQYPIPLPRYQSSLPLWGSRKIMPARPIKGNFVCLCQLCLRHSPDGRQIALAQRTSHLNLVANVTLQDKERIYQQSRPALQTSVQTDIHNSRHSMISQPREMISHSLDKSDNDQGSGKCLAKREGHKSTKTAHFSLQRVDGLCDHSINKLRSSPDVITLMEAENALRGIQKDFADVKRSVPSVVSKKDSVQKKLILLQASVEELQHLHPKQDEKPIIFDSASYFTTMDSFMNLRAATQAALFLAIFFSAVMGISRRAGDFLLRAVHVLIRWVFTNTGDRNQLLASQKDVLKQIPRTLEAALNLLDINVTCTTTFVVCPNCHANYAPTITELSSNPTYPDRCSNKVLPESAEPCDAEMLRDGKPIKTFVYHGFHDYLARLLSRNDLELAMDAACDDVVRDDRAPKAEEYLMDVFDAEYIRNFKGPDNLTLFVDRPGSEGRFLFALNHDFFAADRNTHRGASASCGIISAVCLNLPLDVRYQPENMYIAGIIPGPDKPHNTELNHYFSHVTNDLRESWERGVHYTRTALYPEGRDTRSAAVLAVCDLPGARDFSQCAGHGHHHYCSRCRCYGRDTLTRTDTEDPSWEPKDQEALRQQAENWKHATSQTKRDTLYKDYGMRWSPLWNLPYWDPAKMLVVDPMHCLYEGLAKYQVRDVLQLTRKSAGESEKKIPSFSFPFKPPPNKATDGWKESEIKDVATIHKYLTAALVTETSLLPIDSELLALRKRLEGRSVRALSHVFNSLKLVPTAAPEPRKNPGKLFKKDYTHGLVEWRQKYPLVPMSDPPDKYGTLEVMEHITAVIRDVVTPSWLPSVPFNFGFAAAGSLKADEWRTVSTVHLPIALVSLWGEGTSHKSEEVKTRLRVVLDHTMALFSAISLASMRTQSKERMDSYHAYIKLWLSDLTNVFPELEDKYNRTNGHMAIHIYDFMKLWGPIHGWWCFPFERLIGHIQRLPSNFIFGQREGTMLHSFLRASKLKSWLGSGNCPPIIKECKNEYDDVFADGGIIPDDDIPSMTKNSLQQTPVDLQHIVPESQVILPARHKSDNTIFSRSSTHLGNSLILFLSKGEGYPIPGSIKYIVSRPGQHTFYAVNRQLPSSSAIPDPYRHYPAIPAAVYSTQMGGLLEFVDPSWVVSHYARWQMDAERCVVLDLSRD